ncbi:MAG: hypothetical protein LBG84_04515 [Treponema sp.]|jgi:hypothetical protein|nr:hypothetical protein [Treponema sp.]
MKRLLGTFVFALIPAMVFAGEWDYVPNIEFHFAENLTGEMFEQKISTYTSSILKNHRFISNLPREVSQAMHNELDSYDLDVGDVFFFRCGYDARRPKAIFVVVRITGVNRDGTRGYEFYAWQRK